MSTTAEESTTTTTTTESFESFLAEQVQNLQNPDPTIVIKSLEFLSNFLKRKDADAHGVVLCLLVENADSLASIAYFVSTNNDEKVLHCAFHIISKIFENNFSSDSLLDCWIAPAVRCLSSSDDDLRRVAVYCLGAKAAMGMSSRDEVLKQNVMQPLLACIESEANSPQTLENAIMCLAQLCNHKPAPPLEAVECCVPVAKKLLTHDNTTIVDDAAWVIAYATNGPPSRIDAIESKYTVMDTMLSLLRTARRPSLILPCLSTFGNFTADANATQVIVNKGILQLLPPLLAPDVDPKIRKEVLWMVSNVCAGSDEQRQIVIDLGFIPLAVRNIDFTDAPMAAEAVYVLSNCCLHAGTVQSITALLRSIVEEHDVFVPITAALHTMDARVCSIALEFLEIALTLGETFKAANGGSNPYVDRLKQVGADEAISRLRDHLDHSTFVRSVTLYDRYFDDGWNDEGEEREERADEDVVGGNDDIDKQQQGDVDDNFNI